MDKYLQPETILSLLIEDFYALANWIFFTQTDLWNFKYRTLSSQNITLDYRCLDIATTGNNYHVLASEKLLTLTRGILLQLDQEGNIQSTLRSPALHRFKEIATDPNNPNIGDLYLIGDLTVENTNDVFEDGFLVKLSPNYEVVWAKRIADESAINSKTLALEVFPNGDVAVLFSANGRGYSFLRFASDGTELEQLTLPLPTSDFAIADNENLFYIDNDTLRRSPDELVNRPTISRLTQNPSADDCMLTPSCLIIEDIDITSIYRMSLAQITMVLMTSSPRKGRISQAYALKFTTAGVGYFMKTRLPLLSGMEDPTAKL